MYQQAIDEAEATESVAPVISSPNENRREDDQLPEPAGQTIGEYQHCLVHFDGQHSAIFKSKDENGDLVAVKVTVPHLMGAPHDSKREAQLLREAASPHVIRLVETFGLTGGRLMLVLPFMRHTFEQLLHQDLVTASQIRNHLGDLFRALVHIHSLGIIHRDVKPANLLMDSPAGPAYLGDFGIAWQEGSEGSEPPDAKIIDVCTTCYRPPEILFGCRSYTTALDMWSAGCVVAEAISAGHRRLFDSGPVGSDLALIHSIFTAMGTPDGTTWPVSFFFSFFLSGRNLQADAGTQESARLPDWGKIEFQQYAGRPWEEIVQGSSSNGRDLVSKLVVYESRDRLSAAEVWMHFPMTSYIAIS